MIDTATHTFTEQLNSNVVQATLTGSRCHNAAASDTSSFFNPSLINSPARLTITTMTTLQT
ncbi:hypothetical protein ABH547_01625 [Escherichia coli]|uniref:hypothetical protein n=1 Tax=Escherichia coli TaxID=562 RepID=UPI00326577D0